MNKRKFPSNNGVNYFTCLALVVFRRDWDSRGTSMSGIPSVAFKKRHTVVRIVSLSVSTVYRQILLQQLGSRLRSRIKRQEVWLTSEVDCSHKYYLNPQVLLFVRPTPRASLPQTLSLSRHALSTVVPREFLVRKSQSVTWLLAKDGDGSKDIGISITWRFNRTSNPELSVFQIPETSHNDFCYTSCRSK